MSGNGAKIELIENMREDCELFNESNGRWVVQVKPGYEEAFAKRFDYSRKIGDVDNKISFWKNDDKIVELNIEEARKYWKEPIWNRLA